MEKNIPVFTMNLDSTDIFRNPVLEQEDFFRRLLDFIETNLREIYKTTLLCYLEDSEGNMSEASLEEEGYYKSLNKCIEYFTEIEEYETCSKITKLIKEYELQ